MQNKGAITFFAILLSLVCLFELSFTWIVSRVEADAREYAAGDPLKERAYLDSIAGETVYDIVIQQYTYQECKDRELNLGLDLKGGMNVTLEVSVPDVVRALSRNSQDPAFKSAMETATAKYRASGGDFINLFASAVKEANPDARLSSPAFFGNQDMADLINSKMTNEEVLQVIRQKAEASVGNAYTVIRNRIDKFGVVQPNIQHLKGTDRILVELPGVKDPERVRKLLQGTANLEFWETYENQVAFESSLVPANNKLKDFNALTAGDTAKAAAGEARPDTGATATVKKDSSEMSLLEKLAISGDSGATDSSTLSDKAREDKIRKDNPLFTLLYPNVDNENRYVPGPVVGIALAKDTARIGEILSRPEIRQVMQKDIRFLWGAKPVGDKQPLFQLIAIKVPRDGNPRLTGEHVTNSSIAYGQFNNKPEVSMTMDGVGAGIWRRMTGENVGKSIAIVLDNYVYSYPNVNGEIAGGRSSITGNFTVEEATDLANILSSGKLDAPARIVQEAVVGPSLGKEAINAGLISSLVGLVLVFLFMGFYYSGGGIVADIALTANIFFLMGVMASLGAVLTLPGIAGIVLTIGMSVDANVLIYERIREELAAGKGYKMAIADGYKNAYSAIIDANLTSLLIGIILYVFGSGPIKGFATTLVIGIITSLFAAIFITRLIFEALNVRNRQVKFSIPLTANVLKGSNFDFISQRRKFYSISLVIIGLGVISMFVKGFGYGVDFEGGRSYVVRFEESVKTDAARSLLYDAFEKQNPDVKTFGSSNQLQITTNYLEGDESPSTDSLVAGKMLSALSELNGGKEPVILSLNKVEQTVASDIKESAVLSVIFSLIVLFLYLQIRFRKWQYGVGAIAALAYVVLFLLSVFSLLNKVLPFSLDIDQAFIAAVLTVIGYAINDTVVIFDRIREYLGMYSNKHEDIATVINNALNSTLSRTVVTGITVIIVLLVLFIFGGEVIRGFSFAMLIGVIVGTYTSLFVASPVVVDLTRRTIKKEEKTTGR